MIKKTKAVRFRELYSVIDKLLESYSYESVIEILDKEYDLKIAPGTFRSYLFRFKPDQDEIISTVSRSSIEDTAPKIVDKENNSLEKKEVKKTNVDFESDNEDDEEIDYDALLEQFKNKHKTKSLLDK